MRVNRSGQGEGGAVVVEFAIVFGLFGVLLSGIIQYGVIFAAQQSLAHAASEATRAVVNITDEGGAEGPEDEAEARVADVLAGQLQWMDSDIDNTDDGRRANYNVDFFDCSDGECVEVTVTYNWQKDALVPKLLPVGTPSELSSTANIRYQ